MSTIGIIDEHKRLERRVPLIPSQIEQLVKEHPSLKISVQTSSTRCIPDQDFQAAGVSVEKKEDIFAKDIICSIKQIDDDWILKNKTYVMFSHTIKGQGQDYLQLFLDRGCTLIDYERIVNEKNQRLIFFGNFAGYAGLIDTLWGLDQRFKVLGEPSPFPSAKPAKEQSSLVASQQHLKEAAASFDAGKHTPLIMGILGYGNVAQGVQDQLGFLPVTEIAPKDLAAFMKKGEFNNKTVYKVVFKEEDLVVPKDENSTFELQDYYKNPSKYRSVFEERYADHINVLINCIYWTPEYPRFLTEEWFKTKFSSSRLQFVADITCDINGALACTVQSTEIDDPVFVYQPETHSAKMGFEGKGVPVLGVDILPAELPREASTFFGSKFSPYVSAIASTDFSQPLDQITTLPREIKDAVIVQNGVLTANYQYLKQFNK